MLGFANTPGNNATTEVVAVSKADLTAAFVKWEQQARDGNWQRTPELPVETVAAESADHLWSLLKEDTK